MDPCYHYIKLWLFVSDGDVNLSYFLSLTSFFVEENSKRFDLTEQSTNKQ